MPLKGMQVKIILFVSLVLVSISNVVGNPIVIDGFNLDAYVGGVVVGQNGWGEPLAGCDFRLTGNYSYERGSSMFSAGTTTSGIITRRGAARASGYQSFYFRPERISNWLSPHSFQFGLYQESWEGPSRAVLDFRSDGHAYCLDDEVSLYTDVGTFSANIWNSVEIEWRAADTSARYRLNVGNWSGWMTFSGGSSYSYFDTIGISAISLNGGSVHIDALGYSVIPEPSTLALLSIALATLAVWRRP